MSKTVNYVRDMSYITDNKKPEVFPVESLEALGNQTRIALKLGIIRPDVAALVLPNVLVEGRPGNYGVDAVGIKEIPKAAREALNLEAELAAGRIKQTTVKNQYNEDVAMYAPLNDGKDNYEANAKLKIAGLTVKQAASERKNGKEYTAEDVISRWNGAGPAAARHLSRVVTAAGLLKDGTNKEIKGVWDIVMGADTPNATAVRAKFPTTSLPSSEVMATMSHEDLYALRAANKKDMLMQEAIVPFEHRAYAREQVEDNPLKSISLSFMIPGYQYAKGARLLKEDDMTTPPSVDQLIAGFTGIGEGLRKAVTRKESKTNPTPSAKEE